MAADPNRDGRAETPVPLVLLVHGGPWGRDNYGYDGTAQWLAIAAMRCCRSTPRLHRLREAIITAGDLQWGLKMQDDLTDSVDQAIANKITTPDKVAIMEVEAMAAMRPLRRLRSRRRSSLAASISSDRRTCSPCSRRSRPIGSRSKRQFCERMGNPTTEQGRAVLKAASP